MKKALALSVLLFSTACGGGGYYHHNTRHGTTCHTTVQHRGTHTRTIRTCHHY